MILLTQHPPVVQNLEVINESLRMGNFVPGYLRRAIKDIHVNGYTIPEGWTIMVVPSAIHFNPETYKDPLTFNPWRWKVALVLSLSISTMQPSDHLQTPVKVESDNEGAFPDKILTDLNRQPLSDRFIVILTRSFDFSAILIGNIC
ncbi:hypothetical protein QYF36_006069 [Acer negundo]|nr:hypothetical protein QYF36_006069 [Acer negundo]